ncbi:SMEK domain-containing protein [Neorhizobium sp. LMR1-1-1.1]
MITAGYYIGQLLDDLASIGGQVANRNKVGMTDLTKLLENFYREIINDIHDYSLRNANEERSNAPGLDLIDDVRGIGIQVTSQGGSGKINDTLEVLTDEQIGLYPRIIIMVAGTKQKSYTGLKQEFVNRTNFKIENIWDYTDLCWFPRGTEPVFPPRSEPPLSMVF